VKHSDENEKCRHGFAQLSKDHVCVEYVQNYEYEYEKNADADMNIDRS
jgi:hypothetical protein